MFNLKKNTKWFNVFFFCPSLALNIYSLPPWDELMENLLNNVMLDGNVSKNKTNNKFIFQGRFHLSATSSAAHVGILIHIVWKLIFKKRF